MKSSWGRRSRKAPIPVTHNNSKGLVRAFDVRTGKLIWTFRTIPKPGEFGNDTWLNGSWATNGNTGVWTQMSVDEDLGIAYLPVEDADGRLLRQATVPETDLFGESLVAVDLKTGQRKWHYQLVHHGMWDMDISSRARADRYHRERQDDQGGRAADQTGNSVCL